MPFISIGNQDQTGLPNAIRNYENGIDAANSNFNLYNSIFRDNVNGTAIDLNGNGGTFNANIFGLGNSESSIALIDNYGVGIEGYNYNLTLQNALLKNGVQMIRVSNAVNNTFPVSLNLTNNRIEQFGQEGIACINAKFNNATIQNNTIVDNLDDFTISQTRFGIRWQSCTMVSNNKAQIINNAIKDNLKTSSSGGSEHWRHHGIQISQSTKINIELNRLSQTFQPTDTRLYEGIGLFASPFNDIVYNQVESGGPSQIPDPFFNNEGINVGESGNNLISCNTVKNLYNGISFYGPACDKTQLKSNTIEGDNATGLFLASGTIIGPQSKRSNVWPGNGTTEALFDGDPDQFFVALSKFTISTSNMNTAFWANPRIPAVGWFVPPASEPNPSPSSEACYLNDDPPKSGADELAITGGFQAYKGYPASLWEAELNAFGTLSNHPGLLITGSADLQFYNVYDRGTIGKLSRAVKAWEGIARFNTTFEGIWSNNQSSIVQKLEQIKVKVLEMSQAQTPAQQEQIVQEIAVLETGLLALQQTNQTLSTQYQSDMATSASQLLSNLGNISTTEVWETNLKTVLTLLTQKAGSGNSAWTTTEQSTLQAIADQCRFGGGIGVVLARATIEKSDYNDQAMCPGYAERSNKALKMPAQLAPNPSSDFCTITFEVPTSATLLVSDLQGRLIKILEVVEAYSYVLDTQDLANGLYMVSIKGSQGRQLVSKMVVLH